MPRVFADTRLAKGPTSEVLSDSEFIRVQRIVLGTVR